MYHLELISEGLLVLVLGIRLYGRLLLARHHMIVPRRRELRLTKADVLHFLVRSALAH